MLTWRFLRDAPAHGAWNMAVDEVLMESVRAGAAPTLRVYGWTPACLSFGRNQPAAGRYDAERIRALGVDIVRRPTGGRAVLHEAELTYSVTMPDRTLGSARRAYRVINQVLARGLSRLGAAAIVQPEGAGRPMPLPSTAPCFAEPVPGEVLVGGRKLIGSAQYHAEGVLLQHGSIPLRPGAVSATLEHEGLVTSGTPAYLESVTGAIVIFEMVADAIRTAWTAEVGRCEDADLTVDEFRAARARAEAYLDESWTWRH
jgi:lipoate-protein ligase A